MSQVVETLDDWGKPAWITVMVLGFILFWPIGLAVLAYLIWSGRMGCGARYAGWHGEDRRERFERKMERMRARFDGWSARDRGFRPSGNRAFDAYREETIKRLEDEAKDFREFLDRLRMAKDKAEFDQFMSDRRSRPVPEPDNGATPDQPERPAGA